MRNSTAKGRQGKQLKQVRMADAKLPTRSGNFRIYAFCDRASGEEYGALVKGDVRGKAHVPVRIHSSCLTGDVFGSLRCDCRDQLEMAIHKISKLKCGAVIYLYQEGRGIGLYNKIRAYALQENGYDTAEANQELGFKTDTRDFLPAANALKLLGVKSILLMTNNPRKIADVKRHGIAVAGRIPMHAKPNKYNRRYMNTKLTKLGHMAD